MFAHTLATLGWVGNIALVWGVWEIGNKRRVAHLITCVGETAWIIKSLATGQYDLAVICCVFFVLAARCWVKWAPEPLPDTVPKTMMAEYFNRAKQGTL